MLSLLLRVLPFYDDIFLSHDVNFSTVDAYYHMYVVDNLAHNFPHLSHYLPYLSYPGVQNSPPVYFFDWLLAAIVWLASGGDPTPSLINVVGVYYPAVLGALTVIPVYFIGVTLHSRMAGIIAAALVAIIPGEFLGRSILGSTDQHVMEVLLSTTAMLFLFLALRRRTWFYWSLVFIFSALYGLTWVGSLLFVFIVALYFTGEITKRYGWKSLVTIALVSGIITFLFPEATRSGFSIFYPSGAGLTTAEMQPILAPGGNFTLAVIFANFGLCFFLGMVSLLLILIILLGRDSPPDHPKLPLSSNSSPIGGFWATMPPMGVNRPVLGLILVWSIVILAAMFGQRRFAYYFAINTAILTGFLLAWLAQHKKKPLVLVLLAVMFLSFGNVSHKAFSTPPDWQEAMTWLRENTPEPYGDGNYYYQFVSGSSVPSYTVLSWWDYGYWITRIAHRVPNVNPSQDAVQQKRVASILLSQNNTEAIEELRKLKTRYIVIDSQMVNEKFWAIALWAGANITENSPEYHKALMVRLYNTGKAEDLELIRDINSVKIYELTGK